VPPALPAARTRAETRDSRLRECTLSRTPRVNARDVLTGDLPGPYSDDAADQFARLALETGSECSATHHARVARTTRWRADCARGAPLNCRRRRPARG